VNWLITGGCGFIGTNLITRILSKTPTDKIRVLDNLSVGSRGDLSRIPQYSEKEHTAIKGEPKGVELVVGDVREPDTCIECCDGIDVIVHLAANTGVAPSVENPRQDMEANVLGTFNMLEAARQNNIKRFIFASSGAPVGECEPPIHEELAPHPVSPYGASKLAGEGYCSAYFRTFGVETVSLRFGNVYGPGSGNKNSVIAKFIKQAMKGETCVIYGDGTQTRDFIFIDDLLGVLFRAAVADVGGEIFQIATNKEHTVNEASEIIKSQLEQNYGMDMKIKHGRHRIGDVKRNYSDTSKARDLLGWKASIELEKGVEKTVAWFMNHQAL
jgi:UDP-glucose 4-epimerase